MCALLRSGGGSSPENTRSDRSQRCWKASTVGRALTLTCGCADCCSLFFFFLIYYFFFLYYYSSNKFFSQPGLGRDLWARGCSHRSCGFSMSCLSAFSTEALSGGASFVLFCLFLLVSLIDTKLFHWETRLSAPHICYASLWRSAFGAVCDLWIDNQRWSPWSEWFAALIHLPLLNVQVRRWKNWRSDDTAKRAGVTILCFTHKLKTCFLQVFSFLCCIYCIFK